jgi:competence protein ComEC
VAPLPGAATSRKGAAVRTIFSAIVILLMAALSPAANTLDIYVIDTEGGKAVLIVSPMRDAMLIDAGWAGNGDRDTNRILETMKTAQVSKLDYLVVTHYDVDHVSNVPSVASKVKVGNFVDHGPTSTARPPNVELFEKYLAAIAGHSRIIVKPGDVIPMRGMQVNVAAAAGQTLQAALPAAGAPNQLCADAAKPNPDVSENGRSIGLLFTYGKFRMADFGDLTRPGELALMCPDNRVGTVDLYMVSNHGTANSNAPYLVHALHAKVAIVNNGEVKGAVPEVTQVLRSSPGMQDVWQLHYAAKAGKENNSPDDLIANLGSAQDCAGKGIKISARADGTFTVTNARNGFAKTYKP